LSRKYQAALPGLSWLSDNLGVSVFSLQQLEVGYDGRCYTFPMRDGYNKMVGIRLRVRQGNGKFAVKGSKNALFRPLGVKAESDNILFICEGPTDTAALLDLGFDVIGRASCNTGVGYIKTMIGKFNRTVVIMADKDLPKKRPDGSVSYPGIEGALRLAKELKGCTQSIRVVKPPNYKDIREWYRNGATKAVVNGLVDNTRFVGMIMNRKWAMPSNNTFSITPIGEFVEKYLSQSSRSIDPFARNFEGADITNDLNPLTTAQYHETAEVFLSRFINSEPFDLVIFDPPYSLRQVKEMYAGMGIEKLTTTETHNIGRWTAEKDIIDKILKPGGYVLSFGWHSNGMGKKRNYKIQEILLVAHGGAHNDTICMAEQKQMGLF